MPRHDDLMRELDEATPPGRFVVRLLSALWRSWQAARRRSKSR
jgi:hypothetical protein